MTDDRNGGEYPERFDSQSGLSAEEYGELEGVLSRLSETDRARLDSYRAASLYRGIKSRALDLGYRTIDEYTRSLVRSPQEQHRLVEKLNVGVTSFFRDAETFEWLAEQVLAPALSRGEGDFRVWVPGCSTGEEAYSLAIILRELLESTRTQRSVRMYATDISETAIDTARRGRYQHTALEAMDPAWRERAFEWTGDSWQVVDSVRRMISFSLQNVLSDPPLSGMDLVSCRNLMIYLDEQGQQQVAAAVHFSLKREGVLLLGQSEGGRRLEPYFRPIEPGIPVFKSVPDAAAYRSLEQFPQSGAASESRKSRTRPDEPTTARARFLKEVSGILQRTATAPTIICAPDGTIRYIHGSAGWFLEHSEGILSGNVVDLAVSGLRGEMAAAIRTVREGGGAAERRGVYVGTGAGQTRADFRVERLDAPESVAGMLAIVFRPDWTYEPAASVVEDERPDDRVSVHGSSGGNADYVRTLESELTTLREHYLAVIEDLEAANDDLRARTEELNAKNEELQSMNEEVESAREELRLLNSELRSANLELEQTVRRISKEESDPQDYGSGH